MSIFENETAGHPDVFDLRRRAPGDWPAARRPVRVLGAVCFVYTCRRLIDLSNDCRYGSDVIDMSVEHFLSFTLKSARKLLEAERGAIPTEESSFPIEDLISYSRILISY